MTTPKTLERNLGEQPLMRLMVEQNLKAHDLVAASEEQITHKMVTRAVKGRRLTANVQGKITRAFNRASGSNAAIADLFSY